MMSLTIDDAGRQLVWLARTAAKFPDGHAEDFGTVCPLCLSLNAALALARHGSESRAVLVCGTCGRSRSASVDAPGAVGSEP